MNQYSAAQAITPAIERTKQFLFRPFLLGRFLKLTLVAALTEGGISSCNFSGNSPFGKSGKPLPPLQWPHQLPHYDWPAIPVLIAIVAAVVVVLVTIGIVISYLVIRLRFSYFDCVLRMQHNIAPAWALYHRQAMRYLGMSLCIGLAFAAAFSAVGYWFYIRFKPLFVALGTDNKPSFTDFLPLIGTLILVGLAVGIVSFFLHTALSYFVLPHMALEDASISDAISDVWSDVTAEPWEFLLFVILRFLVTLAASIIAFLILLIPLAVAGVVGIVAALILKSASTGLMVLLGVPAAILVGGLFLVAAIAIGGIIGTFRRNYALLFYGSRYPILGNLLEPPLPPPAFPPWQPDPESGFSSGPAPVS